MDQVRAHTVLDPAGLSVDSQVQVLGGGRETRYKVPHLFDLYFFSNVLVCDVYDHHLFVLMGHKCTIRIRMLTSKYRLCSLTYL